MENDKALSMLGICRRAGKLSCGHDAAQTAIKTGYTMQEIGHATSLRSAVLTVDDRGLASRIQTILNIAYGEDNV